jgi:hypothetical protein
MELDFIGVYDNAFSEEFCKSSIDYFEKMHDAGFSLDRQVAERVTKINKDDFAVYSHSEQLIDLYTTFQVQSEFFKLFWEQYYADYANTFSVLANLAPHNVYGLKLQKTLAGGGYHQWHCEQDSRLHSNRVLAFMLYLNTVEEGGETEFLYQKRRVKAETGRLVIWPSNFTHTHRGNPPLSGSKYIITGWVEF